MNRNVAEAASGSTHIVSTIAGLAVGAQRTSEQVGAARESAGQVAELGAELANAVRRFTV
jgi:methyl-accepting chemotaxis protein